MRPRLALLAVSVRLALQQPRLRGVTITPNPDGRRWDIFAEFVA